MGIPQHLDALARPFGRAFTTRQPGSFLLSLKTREYFDRVKRVANLQILEGSTNTSKGAKLPADWLIEQYSEDERRNLCRLHDLGDIPTELKSFWHFYETRRGRIMNKLRRRLTARTP